MFLDRFPKALPPLNKSLIIYICINNSRKVLLVHIVQADS